MRKTPNYFVDISGNRYGKWVVLDRIENRQGNIYYNCVCDCGTEAPVSKKALVHGKSKSCGCITRPKMNRKAENFNKRYTDEEIELIRAWYPINGSRYLHKHLQRPKDSINRKAKLLGISCNRKEAVCRRHDEWRDWETQVVEEYYPKGGVVECLKRLPNRSKNSIWVRANKLGIKKGTQNGKE